MRQKFSAVFFSLSSVHVILSIVAVCSAKSAIHIGDSQRNVFSSTRLANVPSVQPKSLQRVLDFVCFIGGVWSMLADNVEIVYTLCL